MLQKRSRNFIKASAIVLLVETLVSCATTGGKSTMETCLTDPPRGQFACKKKTGERYFLPWEKASGYVCRPIADDQALAEACLR